MSRQLWIGLFMVLIGLFNMTGAVFNWDWYMCGPQGRIFTRLLGRGSARVLYTIVGLAFIMLGVLAMLGVVPVGE